MTTANTKNIDQRTIDGFGDEWDSFDQLTLDKGEIEDCFNDYFSVFPWDRLTADAEGFDLGCGSGRWAEGVVKRVGLLHCIDPSEKALAVTRRRLNNEAKARFHLADSSAIPLADASQDFGYSLGVLHHIPDTSQAMKDCVRKLKVGAPFLVYLYYRFDNKPAWFPVVWRVSDVMRQGIARLPFGPRRAVSSTLAALVYWPLARLSRVLDRAGFNVENIPLSAYRDMSFYSMRTNSLDRFGTRLEHRFTRAEMEAMMIDAGLTDIRFREDVPYWTAVGYRAA